MKLKFSIHYNTAWGESLHVSIVYRSSDGTERCRSQQMLTDDGCLWTLETAALESRQHPICELCYIYEVHDAEDRVLRREWDMVPRRYSFDTTRDYVFPDQWRDIPLCFHLYSNAYASMMHCAVGEEVKALPLPLFRHTLVFRVSAPQLKAGQSVAVCGSHPALGAWNASRYLRMEYAGQHEWMLSVNALGMLFPLEYKYVVVDDTSHELIAWEDGENRTVMEGLKSEGGGLELREGSVLVMHGGMLRLREEEWRAAGVVVPVFSLRSEHSYGVGDFGDLRRFVDWAEATGMRIIQTLPVCDTTLTHRWGDSYPYNIVSAFALHPHYMDLEALGALKSKQRMTAYRRQQRELNALGYSDYEAVDRVKSAYLRDFFEEQGQQTLQSADFKRWRQENDYWLKDYVQFSTLDPQQVLFTQYHLHPLH